MSGDYSEHLFARVTPEQKAEVGRAAEREGLTPSEIVRSGALRRARTGADGLVVGLGPEATRRVRAAAEMEGVEPEAWAVRALDELAGRRLAGRGIAPAVRGRIDELTGEAP